MLKQLLKKLNSRNADVRRDAMREARALPMEQLLELAALEARRYPKYLRKLYDFAQAFLLIAFTLGGAYSLPTLLHDGSVRAVPLSLTLTYPICGYIWMLLRVARMFTPNRARIAIALLIAEVYDPRFVGPVLALLFDANIRIDTPVNEKQEPYHSLCHALKRMLPNLKATDNNLLTQEQYCLLLLLLDKPLADMELTLCALKALEQIGNEQAIPAVQRVIEELSGVTNRRMIAVREAAEACLPYLTSRSERTRQAQTLLRPAGTAQTASPEILLRPALPATAETPPEQLLRPPAPNML